MSDLGNVGMLQHLETVRLKFQSLDYTKLM